MKKLRDFFEINDGFVFAALSLLFPIGLVVAIAICTGSSVMKKLRDFFEINDGFVFAALSLLFPIGLVVAIAIFA